MSQSSILITAGYGANSRMPFVMIEHPSLDRPIQLSPEEARELAGNLFRAAEHAEADELIVEFAQKKLEVSLEEAAGLLVQIRMMRKEKKP